MRLRITWLTKLSLPLLGALAVIIGWWMAIVKPASVVKIYTHSAPEGAEWIASEEATQYTGCFRKDLTTSVEVQRAWIAVSTYGGFELICNGDSVGAQTLWRPTRMFQNGLTESGQRLSHDPPIVAYNFPREYQWSGHKNDQMVTFFDITSYLKKGKNTIGIEVESRLPQPSVMAFGEVLLTTGEVIPLRTDASWMAEPVAKEVGTNNWALPVVSVKHWRKALKKEGEKVFHSVVPPGSFALEAPKRWVIADGKEQEQSFEASFAYNGVAGSLNILTHGSYWLWVNDTLIDSSSSKKGLNGDEWLVKWEGRRPLATLPELLDSEDAAELFGGERFLDPRHGDPTENNFKRFENTLNRTNERPNMTGGFLLSAGEEEKGRESDPYGFFEEPEVTKPLTILRKRAPAVYHSYDLRELLNEGEGNKIRIRLQNETVLGYKGSQAMKFAVSGGAQQGAQWSALDWKLVSNGELATYGQGVSKGDLARLSFQGRGPQSASMKVGLLLAVGFFLGLAWVRPKRGGQMMRQWLILYLLTVGLYHMLEWSFVERSEILYFRLWEATLFPSLSCVILATLALLALWLFPLRQAALPKKMAGWFCVVLLLSCFILRAWQADHQPIDDDEYASIQAVLAIAETGKPQIADDIWYSRSPLYHYGAAIVAKIFGPHIWSLRLYSVFSAVVTGWLLWMIGKRYMHNGYVAFAALLLFTLHPFLIFSGHIARFYQQQQMFVVLMLHLFIQGFVHGKSIWYRAGAILMFACAVLSQEISIIFVPVFGVLYLLFGKGVKFSWDLKAVLYILFAIVLIGADVALFKVKCLTRATGVSPNVEATLAPTFWELGNLFSLFVGYGRLHLMLGVFYLASVIYTFRRGSRKLIVLHLSLLVSILAFNFVITSQSFRYMYSIIPIFILLACHGMYITSHWVAVHLKDKRLQPYIGSVFLLAVIVSFSPWRIIDSYQEKILGDPISALAYVRKELREEDKVMITEPHPHAAKIELGRVDYDLVVPILYDFTYNKDGVLRDRNGNAEVVNRLAQLQDIFAQNKRVWIIVNREKFRSRKKNIRWEYPSAREELFLRTNCSLRYRSYLWSVFLWDESRGKLKTFRNEANQWVE